MHAAAVSHTFMHEHWQGGMCPPRQTEVLLGWDGCVGGIHTRIALAAFTGLASPAFSLVLPRTRTHARSGSQPHGKQAFMHEHWQGGMCPPRQTEVLLGWDGCA